MNKVRIGVIGMGVMGASHAKWIQEGKVAGAELTAVCDGTASRLTLFPGIAQFSTSDDLIASGLVDAVVVATPHYSHTTIGCAALERGLHVMLEKPISVHKADCERLIAAHKDPAQVFSAMFQQRTDPQFAKIREMIHSGELGTIQRINWIATQWFRTASYYASGTWRATWAGEGGGVLMNQFPHQLDLFQWMFGMPARVRAHCGFGRYHDIEVEDDVTAFLEYPDGHTAVIITSTGEFPGTNRLEIACDRGRLLLENNALTFTRTEVPVSEFCRTSTGSFVGPPVENIEIPLDAPVREFGEKHVDLMRNFVDAIQTGAPLIARAEEGIHSVELANAFILSSVQGRTVDLPMDSHEFEQLLETLKAKGASKHA